MTRTSESPVEEESAPARRPRIRVAGVSTRWQHWRDHLEARRAELEAEPAVLPDVHVTVQAPAEVEREHHIPFGVRATADWSWRFIVICAAVALLAWMLWQIRLVMFPVVGALLLAALLAPLVQRLRRVGLGRAGSTALVFLSFVVFVFGGLTAVGGQVTGQFGDILSRAQGGIDRLRESLANGPLHVDDTQIATYLERARVAVTENQDRLTSGALSTAASAIEALTGVVLALFTLFFFLYDGERIWAWVVRLFPRDSEHRVDMAGRLGWRTLTAYVRGTMIVALVDGGCITVLLLVLEVPLAVPLGVLVFFGAFVPLVGAFVTGGMAVLVALVTQGPISALIVLLGIIAVQQLEGHILQPFLLGRLVRVHPLAVALGIAAGALVAGIPGAIIAVPLVAVTNTIGKYLAPRSEV